MTRGPIFQSLTQWSFEYLKRIVEDAKLHPFNRCNAMLALGDLNAAPIPAGGNPTPLPEALPVLRAAVENSDTLEGLKVEAMVGLSRHFAAGLPAAEKPKMLDLLLLLLDAKKDTKSSRPLQEWMQSQAVVMAGQLGMLGADDQVLKNLAAIVADSKAPLPLRTAAAKSLGQLNYSEGDAAGRDAASLGTGLVQLLIDGCEAELPLTDPDDKPFRRALKAYYDAVWEGINGSGVNQPGVKSFADAATKNVSKS